MVPFVVAIAYLTGWLLLWIALKVSRTYFLADNNTLVDYGPCVGNDAW